MPRVRTPKIVWAATARRVLTMEWIDGVKLTNKEAMAAAGLSVTDFVDVGIECTLRQLLEHGFFHAGASSGRGVGGGVGGWEGREGEEGRGRGRGGGERGRCDLIGAMEGGGGRDSRRPLSLAPPAPSSPVLLPSSHYAALLSPPPHTHQQTRTPATCSRWPTAASATSVSADGAARRNKGFKALPPPLCHPSRAANRHLSHTTGHTITPTTIILNRNLHITIQPYNHITIQPYNHITI